MYYGSAKRIIQILQELSTERFLRRNLSCTNIPVSYFIAVTKSYSYVAKKENSPHSPEKSFGLENSPENSFRRFREP